MSSELTLESSHQADTSQFCWWLSWSEEISKKSVLMTKRSKSKREALQRSRWLDYDSCTYYSTEIQTKVYKVKSCQVFYTRFCSCNNYYSFIDWRHSTTSMQTQTSSIILYIMLIFIKIQRSTETARQIPRMFKYSWRM